MSKSGTKPRVIAVSTVTLMALLSVTGLSTLKTDADETTVYAYFADASPLIKGNDVKVSGVKVGIIDSIEVEDGKARVGLRLDDAVGPLHQDASARVRPVGLLGERYVELDRGTPSAPVIPVGGSITSDHTSSATDLDQVLNMVDQPTGAALAAMVTTLGEGLRGTGPNARDALKAMAPAMQDTSSLVKVLDDQTDVLTSLVDTLEPLATGLAVDGGESLDQLVGSAETLLGVTARNQEAFDQTLAQLPGALSDARRTLRTLAGAARATTPNLRAMRPMTDRLVELSSELKAFSKVADPALDGLDPVLAQAQALIDYARPVAESLHRLGPDLRGTTRGARPVVNGLLGNLRNVLDFVKYWALTTNGEDGLAHYFRAHYVVSSELVTGFVPATGGKTVDSGKKNGLLPDLLPDLPLLDGLLGGSGGDAGLLDGLGSLLGGKATSNSATGLTAQQEQSLIESLIGGN